VPRAWPQPKSHARGRGDITGAVATVVALAALVVGRAYGDVHGPAVAPRVTVWVAFVVLIAAGVTAVRAIAAWLGRHVAHRSSDQAGGVLRLLVDGAGIVVLLFAALAVVGVSASSLLVGAGVAGIVIGIAAQQSLGNVFAALVLVLARPFRVGDYVRIRSGAVGVLEVTIVEIGLAYVTVQTEDGLLKIPNSIVMVAGIGQLSPKAAEPPDASAH
jgi:small conductance mechanosensitive channel